MNIKQAKQEIINTVQAYLTKDETGEYAIPVERQRPVLLIGPPGIGKTAIMEQVARECNINLVSYTITHHTRQSAIGLPFISKKNYDGNEMSVTEYTIRLKKAESKRAFYSLTKSIVYRKHLHRQCFSSCSIRRLAIIEYRMVLLLLPQVIRRNTINPSVILTS